MSRHSISLKARVRYEGRAQIFDRRATRGADLEKLPNPIWRTVGLALHSKFGNLKVANTSKKKSVFVG